MLDFKIGAVYPYISLFAKSINKDRISISISLYHFVQDTVISLYFTSRSFLIIKI